MDDFQISRHDLFAIPLWIVDLAHLEPDVPRLLADVDRCLQRYPAPQAPFEQTLPILHQLDRPWWRRFYGAFEDICETIIGDAYRPDLNTQRSPITRSWAVKMSDPTQFADHGGPLGLLHSHHHHLLSSVFYLSVPPELAGSVECGTMFRDPRASQSSDLHSPNFFVPARPLTMVVFPSFLEHAPAQPSTRQFFSSPRVIIGTDMYRGRS